MDLEPLSTLLDVRHRSTAQPKRLPELVLAQLRLGPCLADALAELDVEAVDLHGTTMTWLGRHVKIANGLYY